MLDNQKGCSIMGIINKIQHMINIRQEERRFDQQIKDHREDRISTAEQLFLKKNIQRLIDAVQDAIKYHQFKGVLRNTVIVKAYIPSEYVDGPYLDSSYNIYEDFDRKLRRNNGYCMRLLNQVTSEVRKQHPEWRISSKINVPSSYVPYNEPGWIVHVV